MSTIFLCAFRIKYIGAYFKIIIHWIGQLFPLIIVPIYYAFMGVCKIVFFAEYVFKCVAGIDTIYLKGTAYGGGSGNGQDLVYAFIMDSSVQNVFWSIIALSFLLLIIFTIVALIKSEFTLDLKGTAKGPIIGRALKSLVNFIVVPSVTLIGIIGINYLSKTIYDLFGNGQQTVLSKVFYVGAYNANRVRNDSEFAEYVSSGEFMNGGSVPFSGSGDGLASSIDTAFMNFSDASVDYKDYTFDDLADLAFNDKYVPWHAVVLTMPDANDKFTLWELEQMNFYYNLWKFDYVLALGSAIAIGWTLLTVCLVLIKRVFELTILYLLAPPMIAIAPLDGGQAEKKWRSEFLKRALSVIGPIFAYNMYFLFLPLFENISLFGNVKMSLSSSVGSGIALLGSYQTAITDFTVVFNTFFQIICVYVGMSILKSASALLSTLLGVEDLVKTGAEASKKALDVGKKAALGATAIVGVGVRGAAALTKGFMKQGERRRNDKKEKLSNRKEELEEKIKSGSYAGRFNDERELNKIKRQQSRMEKVDNVKDKGKAFLKKSDDLYKKAKTKASSAAHYLTNGFIGSKDISKEMASFDDEIYGEKGKDGKRSGGLEEAARAATEAFDKAKERGEGPEELGKLQKARDEANAALTAKKAEKDNLVKKSRSSFGEAIYEEYGPEAKTLSTAAKIQEVLKKHSLYNDTIGKSLFMNSMFEWLNPESEQVKRRLNDALTGLFGEVGGELNKIRFNKNARAGLYEGIPESKARSEGVAQSLSWGARDKYYAKQEESKARKEEEKHIRRMLAEEKLGDKYSDLIRQLESTTNPTKVSKLNAQIEKMEIDNGIAREARRVYDNPTDAEKEKYKAFNEKMKLDASEKAAKDELAHKQRAANIFAGGGGSGGEVTLKGPVETKPQEDTTTQVDVKNIQKGQTDVRKGQLDRIAKLAQIGDPKMDELLSGFASIADIMNAIAKGKLDKK